MLKGQYGRDRTARCTHIRDALGLDTFWLTAAPAFAERMPEDWLR